MTTNPKKVLLLIVSIFAVMSFVSCESSYKSYVSISVDSTDFGFMDIHTQPIKIVLFKNKGSKSVTILKTELINGDTSQFKITGGEVLTDTQVVSKGQHPITIKFIPEGGAATILLSVQYLDSKGVKRIKGVRFSGFGVEHHSIEINRTAINFKKVKTGTFIDKLVTIKSIGTLELIITDVDCTNSVFTLQPNWDALPVELKSGSSVAFAVRYSPTDEIISDGTLSIEHNATNLPSPIVIQLSGKGVDWTPPFIYETFDDEDAGVDWVATGDWELGQPDILYGPATDKSGTGQCYGTKQRANYSENQTFNSNTLTSPVFNLKDSSKPKLFFYQWHAVMNNDGGLVQISKDSGKRWIDLDSPVPVYNSWAGGKKVFSGNADWHLVSYDLTAFKNFEEVKIRFAFFSDDTNQSRGWFIDDVIIVDVDAVPPFKPCNPMPAIGTNRIPAVGNEVTFSWTSGLLTDAFTIYMDTNPEPTTQIISSQNTKEFKLSNLVAGETYYWRVDAVNLNGVTKGDVWTFTTADYATIPAVLINEVETGNYDYIEIFNASGYEVDISGWELYIYSYCWEINRLGQLVNSDGLNGVYVFPENTILDADEVIVVYEYGVNSRFVTNFNIILEKTSSAFEIALYFGPKKYNVGCDYLAANLSGVYPNIPAMTNWTGNLFGSADNRNFYRNSALDTDDASDWSERLGSADIGSKNPNQ